MNRFIAFTIGLILSVGITPIHSLANDEDIYEQESYDFNDYNEDGYNRNEGSAYSFEEKRTVAYHQQPSVPQNQDIIKEDTEKELSLTSSEVPKRVLTAIDPTKPSPVDGTKLNISLRKSKAGRK